MEAKKEEMFSKRAGSLAPSEPKIIWVKVLHHSHYSEDQHKLAEKFNAILEETISSKKMNYIMDLEKSMRPSHFDFSSNFTGKGRIKFWTELDTQIKQFNQHELTLKP